MAQAQSAPHKPEIGLPIPKGMTYQNLRVWFSSVLSCLEFWIWRFRFAHSRFWMDYAHPPRYPYASGIVGGDAFPTLPSLYTPPPITCQAFSLVPGCFPEMQPGTASGSLKSPKQGLQNTGLKMQTGFLMGRETSQGLLLEPGQRRGEGKDWRSLDCSARFSFSSRVTITLSRSPSCFLPKR